MLCIMYYTGSEHRERSMDAATAGAQAFAVAEHAGRYMDAAIKVLVDLMHNAKSEAVRLSAARELMKLHRHALRTAERVASGQFAAPPKARAPSPAPFPANGAGLGGMPAAARANGMHAPSPGERRTSA